MAEQRQILHVDLDAFFASVEQMDDPALRGKPVLIGHDGPRGVVSTASYEARPFGCRSAMPMAAARRLCPQAIVVRPRFARYRELSDRMFAILDRYTPQVEPVGIDEAFLDVTGSIRLHGPAERIAGRIKTDIRAELGIGASVGLAPNKFLAKLASDFDKPDGLTVVTEAGKLAWLAGMPVSRVWGIGPKSAARLNDRGVRTIGDLRRMDAEWMRAAFGQEAEHFSRLSRGEDDRPVTSEGEARSISHEQTFGQDLADPEAIRGVLLEQSEDVARRLRKYAMTARTITVKIRFGDFRTVTRSITLAEPTDRTADVWHAARDLFNAWCRAGFQPVRLIGVAGKQLAAGAPVPSLFPDPADQRQTRLDQTLDRIATRFGRPAVRRGKTGEADE